MRDHRKLRAFAVADATILQIYRGTQDFPTREQYGLASQMRRAAVSIASNLVEGSSRSATLEYLRFIEIACGSARELEYQLDLAKRLGYWPDGCDPACSELSRLLARLHQELAKTIQSNRGSPSMPRKAGSRKTFAPEARSPKPDVEGQQKD